MLVSGNFPFFFFFFILWIILFSLISKIFLWAEWCSGLAAAYKLKSHGLNVTVFEAEGRAGGKLRSVSDHGLIWDEGANTMVNFWFYFDLFINQTSFWG